MTEDLRINGFTFEEAMTTDCPHGIRRVIVCPKCYPERYKMTPAIIAAARLAADEYEIEKGVCLHVPKCVLSVPTQFNPPAPKDKL
jgi:hypothetical protein